jgi:hypothetical protein
MDNRRGSSTSKTTRRRDYYMYFEFLNENCLCRIITPILFFTPYSRVMDLRNSSSRVSMRLFVMVHVDNRGKMMKRE